MAGVIVQDSPCPEVGARSTCGSVVAVAPATPSPVVATVSRVAAASPSCSSVCPCTVPATARTTGLVEVFRGTAVLARAVSEAPCVASGSPPTLAVYARQEVTATVPALKGTAADAFGVKSPVLDGARRASRRSPACLGLTPTVAPSRTGASSPATVPANTARPRRALARASGPGSLPTSTPTTLVTSFRSPRSSVAVR